MNIEKDCIPGRVLDLPPDRKEAKEFSIPIPEEEKTGRGTDLISKAPILSQPEG